MNKSILLFWSCIIFLSSVCVTSDVGYRVTKAQGYKKIRANNKSALYEVVAPQLDDGKPIKLLDLHGNHQQIGYDYGFLMADQIKLTSDIFFKGQIQQAWELQLIYLFLDWQYQNYVVKQIPLQFIDQLKGIEQGTKEKGHKHLRAQFQRILVISSFPGAIQNDAFNVLFDQFLKAGIKNQFIQNMIEKDIIYAGQVIKKFINKRAIQCSFFGVWGSRTKDGQLYTTRNLDWLSNSGINVNKLIIVWSIDGAIPHLTLGFPGLLGSLTGMSRQGLTMHEAGMSNFLQTEIGFQWTLRMRYVMMYAKNLTEAKKIWMETKNTLGMNYMIGSAKDVYSGHPAMAIETMRDYSAFFYDNDTRQVDANFTDPKTQKQYRAGFAMPEAIFRTNHAYDPKIRQTKVSPVPQNDDSMIRYRILKDYFNQRTEKMGAEQALQLIAIVGDKGSQQFKSCNQKSIHHGLNVISVLYQPRTLRMWAGFEYSGGDKFLPACCGVYVQMDMAEWLNRHTQLEQLSLRVD